MKSTELAYVPAAHGRLDGWIMRAALMFAGRFEPSEEDVFEISTSPRLLADVLVITGLLRDLPTLYVEASDMQVRAIIRRAGDDFRARPETKEVP